MEKVVSFDKQGRLYLPEELREYIRFKTFIAIAQGKGIYLQPIEQDPLEALSKLGKDKLKTKSFSQLKKEARGEIEENAAKKIRRH
ncbi:MAG: AbrB/MazE/SpoVT family DNA-binding domain-containing protein [Nanoarchaeota archaeon]